MSFLFQYADALTWIFFALGDMFKWIFDTLLTESAGEIGAIVFTVIGAALFIWWCIKLIGYDKEDKPYTGW